MQLRLPNQIIFVYDKENLCNRTNKSNQKNSFWCFYLCFNSLTSCNYTFDISYITSSLLIFAMIILSFMPIHGSLSGVNEEQVMEGKRGQQRFAYADNTSTANSSSSLPPPSTTTNFNFAAVGDWGCTDHTTDTMMIKKETLLYFKHNTRNILVFQIHTIHLTIITCIL